MLAGMVLPGLGQVMAVIALPFVSYTIRVVNWLGTLSMGEWQMPAFHPALADPLLWHSVFSDSVPA